MLGVVIQNGNYKSVDGVLMQIVGENNLKLLKYPSGNKREEYITPSGLTSVVQHAFLDTFYLILDTRGVI